MVAPFLGDEEIQREEAQEDSDGCEGRGSEELGTEGQGVTRLQGSGHTTSRGWEFRHVPLHPALYKGYGDLDFRPHVYTVRRLLSSLPDLLNVCLFLLG